MSSRRDRPLRGAPAAGASRLLLGERLGLTGERIGRPPELDGGACLVALDEQQLTAQAPAGRAVAIRAFAAERRGRLAALLARDLQLLPAELEDELLALAPPAAEHADELLRRRAERPPRLRRDGIRLRSVVGELDPEQVDRSVRAAVREDDGPRTRLAL